MSHESVRSPISALSVSTCALEAAAPAALAPPLETAAAEPDYSIRFAEETGTCSLCLEATGTGPVGFLSERPVCDACMLEECVELGMVLALVAVTREYGAFEARSEAEWHGAMAELGAFARIFEQFSAPRFGPRRRVLRPDDLSRTH